MSKTNKRRRRKKNLVSLTVIEYRNDREIKKIILLRFSFFLSIEDVKLMMMMMQRNYNFLTQHNQLLLKETRCISCIVIQLAVNKR